MLAEYITYLFFRILIIIFKILPLRFLYSFSDCVSFILRKIIKYRYSTAKKNIRQSFLEISDNEVQEILKKHYKYLGDLIVETIKGFTLNKKIEKHIYPENIELMNLLYEKYNGIIGVLGHYGNWEWAGLLAGMQLKQKPIIFYNPISNKYIDNYIRKLRGRSGCTLVSIKYTKRAFEEFATKKSFFAMVADQSPSNLGKAYWLKFLNQETACIHGPEKYAKIYNLPVVYVKISRIKRGLYSVNFKMITENPQLEPDGEITRKFFTELESDIKKEPHLWLWTHRRWKHKRKQNYN